MLIIDTDPGIDDAVTILAALAGDPVPVDHFATVFGNVPLERTTENLHLVLRAAGRAGTPVAVGAASPLFREAVHAPHIHGNDGLAGITAGLPKPELANSRLDLSSLIRSSPTPVTFIGLGPLTNLAAALLTDPEIAANIERVIVQGGAVLTWGNTTPAATFNHYSDPEAAAVVYRSGVPVVQVGMDVCRYAGLRGETLLQFQDSTSEGGQFLWQIFSHHWRLRGGALTAESFLPFNDSLCLAYLLEPGMFTSEVLAVEIEITSPLTRGATVADFDRKMGRPASVEVLLDVDLEAYASFMTERLTSLL
ncbi:nucleoside hydrolase [Georgenia sp. H159]|uniref:nucleoside hydrolase n=1 Tax=Georgenia sp. H159 TaxID=3076115 RepID=UPI002D789B3E|nr:nucleoside hydrolase [Georgenia sp. H159]